MAEVKKHPDIQNEQIEACINSCPVWSYCMHCILLGSHVETRQSASVRSFTTNHFEMVWSQWPKYIFPIMVCWFFFASGHGEALCIRSQNTSFIFCFSSTSWHYHSLKQVAGFPGENKKPVGKGTEREREREDAALIFFIFKCVEEHNATQFME